jgi:nitrile hydratase accessory protein
MNILSRPEPAFAEVWHGRALALAMQLTQSGHFTRTEWATALGRELQKAANSGQPDDGSRYYHHCLAALESLLAAKGLLDQKGPGR